ncbi:MAG: radical SAM protein [Candidatus Aenigmatarchaeota archaeon]
MKICLIDPGFTFYPYQSLGILYIGSFLEENGKEVCFLNFSGQKIDEEKIRKILTDIKPDILGITCAFGQIKRTLLISKVAKELGAKVVCGGLAPTALPMSFIENDCIDYVVVGEGEHTMLELCEAIENKKPLKKVKGLVFKENGKKIWTGKREEADLNKLPPPAWYMVNEKLIKRLEYVYVVGSRGCNYRCSHCFNRCFGSNRLRTRNPKSIVDEIEYLYRKYGIKNFKFGDNDFTLDEKWGREICREIIKRKIKIKWTCFSHIRDLSLDLLRLMRRAGCIQICFGVESGSEKVLKILNRSLNLEVAKKCMGNCKRTGILVLTSFIFGIPGDEVKELKKTVEVIKELKPDICSVFWYTPIPGTPLFEIAKKCGLKERRLGDWDNLNLFTNFRLVKDKKYNLLATKIKRNLKICFLLKAKFIFLPKIFGIRRAFRIIMREIFNKIFR